MPPLQGQSIKDGFFFHGLTLEMEALYSSKHKQVFTSWQANIPEDLNLNAQTQNIQNILDM